MVFNFSQLLKADASISLTLLGISMDDSLRQPLKIPTHKATTPWGILIFSNDEQLLNAYFSILLTLLPKTAERKDVQ
jgi:hypothetical protein